jgi:trans-2,3-dihydro-3-hydroxyanthranilate isomerase
VPPRSFVVADVFTATPFGGNQLAVVPDARGLSGRAMQTLAREFNFAETSFVLPNERSPRAFGVRIFTPKAELPFAGHPTVGTAAVLAHLGQLELTDGGAAVVLEEGVGPVTVAVRPEGGRTFARLTVDRGPDIPEETPSRGAVAASLSLAEDDVRDAWFAGVGAPFCFAHLGSREAVDRATLDRSAWRARLADAYSSSVFLFAGSFATTERLYARMFAPALGIEEDPATGSACVSLVGALAARSPDRDGMFELTIDQGVAMGRPSVLEAAAEKSGGRVTRIHVGGHTVVVAQGTIEVPASL